MKQLLQNLRTGEISIIEGPDPQRPRGFVLVSTRASLISSGTERSTVLAAKASLLGKARQRPDKVRQVLDNVRKEGLLATIAKVKNKLDEPKALGYSCSGVVLDCDEHEPDLRVGDRVACAGQDYASHAEIVVVPRNLVVPIPESATFEEGAFAAVGAIALQGIRRAEIQLGCRVLVIGLGLLGHLSWMLLEDCGCEVVGTDISNDAVETARRLGLRRAIPRVGGDVEGACLELTGGGGVDAVLITASTKSNDPIELAGRVARERARVVVVGSVPMDVPRDPDYYRKELDIVISRSYGPGRYDPEYEEGGVDYPAAHVRWTEGRNMLAFLEAIKRERVRPAELISHRFSLENAVDAYQIVSGERHEPHIGIVLTYPESTVRSTKRALTSSRSTPHQGEIVVGFIGAGSFARTYLLPHFRGNGALRLKSVATSRGHTAVDVARKFGFAEAASSSASILNDPEIDAIVIATRHSNHAELTRQAVESGKHVLVEKPLAISPEALDRLIPALLSPKTIVQTGFNRRFSPLAVALRDALDTGAGPTQLTYRVNAGPLPADHWLLDPEQGGGRIVGEACHFVDLMCYLTGELPARVSATRFGDDNTGATTAIIDFDGGSVGNLVYQANASTQLAKERVEAFRRGRGGVIHDWRSVELFDQSRVRTVKARGQAKGYAEEIARFVESIRTGSQAMSIECQVMVTRATFGIVASAASRQPYVIENPFG
jgi:polar amino acid transport system substrate-binding protein